MFSDEQAQTIQKSFLAICTPCYGGQVMEKHYVSMISYTIACMKNNMTFSVETLANESLVTRARNNLVAKMMMNPKATHLMFIDADVGFDTESVYKLIAHNKDVIGGIYPKKTFQADYVFNPTPNAKREGDLIEVDDIGTGFLLIKREVIQKMFDSFPDLKYRNNINIDPNAEPFMYALFDTLIDKQTNTYLSEDYTFCERWRGLGGKIYADTSIELTHTGYYSFKGDVSLLQNN
jgi:hypothetical protein